MDFFRRCWGFAIPLVVLILAGPLLLLAGASHKLIFLMVNGGTVVVITGTLLYIIFYDSRYRWPTLKVKDRAIKILTMQR